MSSNTSFTEADLLGKPQHPRISFPESTDPRPVISKKKRLVRSPCRGKDQRMRVILSGPPRQVRTQELRQRAPPPKARRHSPPPSPKKKRSQEDHEKSRRKREDGPERFRRAVLDRAIEKMLGKESLEDLFKDPKPSRTKDASGGRGCRSRASERSRSRRCVSPARDERRGKHMAVGRRTE